MSKRPISVENIGGRMANIPKDIRQIIEPMSHREYLRLRKLAENITDYVVSHAFNPKFVNYDIAIDDLIELMAPILGFNLDDFIMSNHINSYKNLNSSDIVDLLKVKKKFFNKIIHLFIHMILVNMILISMILFLII